jgi:flagellar motor switch protein FliN/FliY
MSESHRSTVAHEFREIARAEVDSATHLEFEDLKNVRVPVAADLGQTTMYVRDILELKVGSVVQLTKIAGEMTDIYVNGLPLAKGEVVVIADSIHVRISEILGAREDREEEINLLEDNE